MHKTSQKGFTLLELLIVVAILATLSAVTVVVLNPAELLKKSRDSQRLSDIASIKTALAYYMTAISSPVFDGGTNTLCDTTHVWATQQPAGVTGMTVATSTSGVVSGTGWIKTNLTSITEGSPLSVYPIDPNNTSSYFYAFACKSSPIGFELMAKMESTYYSQGGTGSLEDKDGGNNSKVYETGSVMQINTANLNTLYGVSGT